MNTSPPALRYLCLTSSEQLEKDIDSWWTRMVGDKPIWGPGLPGWDPQLDADANLRRRFGDLCQFDAIFLSHAFTTPHEGGHHQPPTPTSLGNRPTVAFQHEVRAVEDYSFAARGELCYLEGVDLVLYAYNESELDYYEAQRELKRLEDRNGRAAHQMFRRLPHHVRTDLFYPPPDGNRARDLDVVLVGRAHESLYPLRSRWARLIAERRWSSAEIVVPLYGRQSTWTRAERDAEIERYAGYLRRAKIVVSCSSYWRYMLAKFNEIAACGAFIVSDVATHMPQPFIDNMGIVSSTMRDSELVEVVDGWLLAASDRQLRAGRLRKYVTENCHMQRFWECVDKEVREWKHRWRSREGEPPNR